MDWDTDNDDILDESDQRHNFAANYSEPDGPDGPDGYRKEFYETWTLTGVNLTLSQAKFIHGTSLENYCWTMYSYKRTEIIISGIDLKPDEWCTSFKYVQTTEPYNDHYEYDLTVYNQ